MTMFSKIRLLALGTGFAIAAMWATLAQSGGAEAASGLSQCTGPSRQKVIDCCEKRYSGHRPLWMLQNHSSCSKAVVCRSLRMSLTAATLTKVCSIQPHPKESDGSRFESQRTISDIRLKTGVHRIGTTVLGLPLYTFQYRNRAGVYVGVMAQDVLKVEPQAVSIGADGYYLVDYGKLGIAMERIQ